MKPDIETFAVSILETHDLSETSVIVLNAPKGSFYSPDEFYLLKEELVRRSGVSDLFIIRLDEGETIESYNISEMNDHGWLKLNQADLKTTIKVKLLYDHEIKDNTVIVIRSEFANYLSYADIEEIGQWIKDHTGFKNLMIVLLQADDSIETLDAVGMAERGWYRKNNNPPSCLTCEDGKDIDPESDYFVCSAGITVRDKPGDFCCSKHRNQNSLDLVWDIHLSNAGRYTPDVHLTELGKEEKAKKEQGEDEGTDR